MVLKEKKHLETSNVWLQIRIINLLTAQYPFISLMAIKFFTNIIRALKKANKWKVALIHSLHCTF